MGARSGKLVITHDQKPTESAGTESKPQAESEAPCSIAHVAINGDFRPIDAPEGTQEGDTPIVNGHAEEDHTEITATTDQINGTVSPSDEAAGTTDVTTEKTPKKHKNPITWIQRRISKKSLSFNFGAKSSSADKTAATSDDQEKTVDADVSGEKVEDQVTGVADNLVDEVINSATAISQSEQETPKTETQVITEVIEESEPVVSECPPETPEVFEPAPIPEKEIPVPEQPIVNGGHIEGEEEIMAVPDTNNTNGTCEQHDDTHPVSETYQIDEDAMASKLASLELTNGHSQLNEVPAVNGCGGEAVSETHYEN